MHGHALRLGKLSQGHAAAHETEGAEPASRLAQARCRRVWMSTQEAEVECGVVGDDDPVADSLAERLCDRAQRPTAIARTPSVFLDSAEVRIEHGRRELCDDVAGWVEASGFKVQNHPWAPDLAERLGAQAR